MIRKIRRGWRRYYRNHREGLELLGDFLGVVGVFAWIYFMYIFLWLFQ